MAHLPVRSLRVLFAGAAMIAYQIAIFEMLFFRLNKMVS